METTGNIPLVSICCATYNHENYIRQCLEGFVMQKTTFSYEVIINDDCSTDGTASIIKEFADKYPELFVPFYQEKNLYSQGVDIFSTILCANAKGKYIAICEGDDYWTDPLKLQKQVDFLEANPEYSMCFHIATEHWEDRSKTDQAFNNIESRDYSGAEIYERWIIPTASVIFKRMVVQDAYYRSLASNPNFCFGDILLFISCAKAGKVRGLDECMSVYRRHETGVSLNTSNVKKIKHNLEVYKTIGGQYKETARRFIFEQTKHLISKENAPLRIRLFFISHCLLINPIKFIIHFCLGPIKKLVHKTE